jgi:hypothetical protein
MPLNGLRYRPRSTGSDATLRWLFCAGRAGAVALKAERAQKLSPAEPLVELTEPSNLSWLRFYKIDIRLSQRIALLASLRFLSYALGSVRFCKNARLRVRSSPDPARRIVKYNALQCAGVCCIGLLPT